MSTMYKLPPAFSPDFEVHPKQTCYRLDSYHRDLPGQSQCNGTSNGTSSTTTETDPVKVLEKRQLELIEKLNAQAAKLNELLAAKGKAAAEKKHSSAPAKSQPAAKAEASKKAQAPAPAAQAQNDKKDDGKKDKDAKKEARKAAKADAKNKVASGEGSAPAGAAKGKGKDAGRVLTIPDDRKTWESALSLTANIPSTLVNYPEEHLGQVTLSIVASQDEKWLSKVAKAAAKRNVAFTGHVSNGVKNAKTTINVVAGKEFGLTMGETRIGSRVTVWKLLGLATGLFSRKSEQTLSAAHQSLWLMTANHILAGHQELSLAEREASQFLARFDSLSSQWDVTIADVVFRSLLDDTASHPSNVETWAKKIDALIA